MGLMADNYSWFDDVVSMEAAAVLFDEESCWLADAAVLGGEGAELLLDGAPSGASGLWLGYSVVEEFEGTPYVYDGYTSTAAGEASGDTMVSQSTGMHLEFSEFSGLSN